MVMVHKHTGVTTDQYGLAMAQGYLIGMSQTQLLFIVSVFFVSELLLPVAISRFFAYDFISSFHRYVEDALDLRVRPLG